MFSRKREYFIENQINLTQTNCIESGHFGSTDLVCMFHMIFVAISLFCKSQNARGILLHLFQTAFLVADFKLVILVYLFLEGKVEGDGDA